MMPCPGWFHLFLLVGWGLSLAAESGLWSYTPRLLATPAGNRSLLSTPFEFYREKPNDYA